MPGGYSPPAALAAALLRAFVVAFFTAFFATFFLPAGAAAGSVAPLPAAAGFFVAFFATFFATLAGRPQRRLGGGALAISSRASSSEIVSGSRSFGRRAFFSPSVSYGPQRPRSRRRLSAP